METVRDGVIYKKHVAEPWFTFIKNGLKKVEGRLNRRDFAEMNKGDIIVFWSGEKETDNVIARIEDIRKYDSFEEMVETEGKAQVLPGLEGSKRGAAVYRDFFSEEDEKQYGVLAIEFTTHGSLNF